MQQEGLYLGTSSAINVAGAMRMAKALGPGKTVVTVLCDSASRYPDKLFNVEYLEGRNLPTPGWIRAGVSADIQQALEDVTVSDETALDQQKAAELAIAKSH